MKKENSKDIFSRIVKNAIIIEIVSLFLVIFFTWNAIYCIISIVAALLSVSGFLLLIKIVNRLIEKKAIMGVYFALGLAKMLVITLSFYLVSKVSETAGLIFLIGLSMVVFGIMAEGAYQVYRSFNGSS